MSACVYVIQADNGEVKVGWSGTPYARLSSVKREYSARRGFSRAVLIGFVQTPAFVEVELLAIRSLLGDAVGGEWFRCAPAAAIEAIMSAAREFDPAAEWKTV